MHDHVRNQPPALPADSIPRRRFVQAAGAAGAMAAIASLLPEYAHALGEHARFASASALEPRIIGATAVFELAIAETPVEFAARRASATTINGTIPGPLIRLTEGQDAVLRVTNHLHEDTSIHWHGVLVPPTMDGVPGLSFPGIRPGETFEYKFPLHQYGTYWYHSHSGLQEQTGVYGPLLIQPAEGFPYKFDREHVLVLSDWTFEDPYRVLAKLKKQGNYYNYQRRTVGDFFRDVRTYGFRSALEDRMMWSRMRMDPTDISDVTGATYTFLLNGMAPASNWTGQFQPGERVLLHIINASAASYFDLRIPGLPMTVVQASGQYVQPVETDEIRIAIAETYDVIVQPGRDQAYTVYAEAMDRSGYARGTLAPSAGMAGAVPSRRIRPVLTMSDMGMGGMSMPGMDMTGAGHAALKPDTAKAKVPAMADMPGMGTMPAMSAGSGADDDANRMAIAGATWSFGLRPPGTISNTLPHEPSGHGPGNSAVPMITRSRLGEPGPGLGDDGWRVLRYTDLRALKPRADFRPPEREIELHLTGNMERFMWSIDGVEFAKSAPIAFGHNERIRLTMVNDTMMNHPMHLHGMWMELENGHGELIPRVHTVNVKPSERLSLLITPDTPGRWAFHCHVLYHMDVGMFRIVEVSEPRAVHGDAR